MEKTAQISKEKRQSIITLRHERQSIWKISRTSKVSSSAETIKRYDETSSHEDRHRKGRPRATSTADFQRIRLLELPASEIADQINASQSSINRHINCSEETT